jgi:hypothetical protein
MLWLVLNDNLTRISALQYAARRRIFNAQRPLNDEEAARKFSAAISPCNPLKSPDRQEEIQGHASKFKINIGVKRKRISEIPSKYKQKITVIAPWCPR